MLKTNFKSKLIFPVVIIFAFFALAQSADAATYYVSPSGTGDCTIGAPCSNPDTAEGKADVTDIQFRAGTYTTTISQWIITKPNLKISNYPGETVVINGEFLRPSGTAEEAFYKGLIEVRATGITVTGLTIKRSRGFCIHAQSPDATYGTYSNLTLSGAHHSSIAIGYGTKTAPLPAYNVVDNCLVEYGNLCMTRGEGTFACSIGTTLKVKGIGNVVKNNVVRYSAAAGIEGYQDAETIIENNIVYGNKVGQIHFAISRNNIVRNNLIYGINSGVPMPYGYPWTGIGAGSGIGINAESWYPNVTMWDYGHKVYNNLVANCRHSLSVEVNENGPYTPQLKEYKIYNNTFIEPSMAILDPWIGWSLMFGTNHNGMGYGSEIKNNIFFSTAGRQVYGTVPTDKVIMANNLWSSAPTATARSATDSTYPAYATQSIANYFAKASGWNSLSAGSLSANDFKLLSAAANAINKGTALGTEYNRDYWNTLRPQGAGWDIGAHEYAAGDTTAPTSPSGLSVR